MTADAQIAAAGGVNVAPDPNTLETNIIQYKLDTEKWNEQGSDGQNASTKITCYTYQVERHVCESIPTIYIYIYILTRLSLIPRKLPNRGHEVLYGAYHAARDWFEFQLSPLHVRLLHPQQELTLTLSWHTYTLNSLQISSLKAPNFPPRCPMRKRV